MVDNPKFGVWVWNCGLSFRLFGRFFYISYGSPLSFSERSGYQKTYLFGKIKLKYRPPE